MKSLVELEEERVTFSIGQAISDGWTLVAKNLGFYILGGIITVAIGMVLGFIPFVGSIANNLIVSPCLWAGGVYVTWLIANGSGWTDFGDMFKGFKFLTPVIISALIQGVVSIIIALLFFFNFIPDLIELYKLLQSGNAYTNQEEIKEFAKIFLSGKSFILFALFMIAMLIIGIIWAFKTHFIVIYKLQAWQAMEMSRKISTNNFFQLVGLFLLLGIIILISVIPCGIGLFFSLPLMIGAFYSAFNQITHCSQINDSVDDLFDFTGNQ